MTVSYNAKKEKSMEETEFNSLEIQLIKEGVGVEVIKGIRKTFQSINKEYWNLLKNIHEEYKKE
ncbi:MAG: hypothetical protein JW791_05260 [Nanoarchaeota archaeon]|nr:hypothetical protein [Nanoarchaeota archaeon]